MVLKNLLGLLDRQSTRSTLIGETGSIWGFIFTVGFLLIAVMIYLTATIDYFNGDYYQSEFKVYNSSQVGSFGSGRDFRIAIVFKSKINDSLYNHSEILRNLTASYTLTTSQNTFYSLLQPCHSNYLSKNAINPVHLDDCLMIPDNTLFDTQGIIKLNIENKCSDPFSCANSLLDANSPILILLKDYYYELYFTSIEIDQKANSHFRIHKIYSFEYFGDNTVANDIYIQYEIKKTTIDDSFMPWRNHRITRELKWNGYISGNFLTGDSINSNGLHIQFSVRDYNSYGFRYYHKLDYLLGIIGGGCFLLYLIFWVPFSWFNRTLQKMQNANKLMLDSSQMPYKNLESLHLIEISWKQYLCGLIPFSRSNYHMIIERSQQKLNIVRLLKKIKTAERNLQKNRCNPRFQPRELKFDEHGKPEKVEKVEKVEQGIDANEISRLIEIPPTVYNALKQSCETVSIYENNPSMLAITNHPDKIAEIFDDQKLDKINTNIAVRRTFLLMVQQWFTKVFKWFDVFGAQPNFLTEPENSSCWGLLITLIILVLGILTVIGTLSNMGHNQIFSTYNTVRGDQASIEMITGPQTDETKFQMMVCFNVIAWNNGYLVGTGTNRSAQLKFFTNETFQNGTNSYKQYDALVITPQDDYVVSTDIDMVYLLASCRRIPNNIPLKASSTPSSRVQSTFGILLKPFCFGTPQECINRITQTNSKFTNFINSFAKSVLLPKNNYSPNSNRVGNGFVANELTEALSVGESTPTAGIEETLYADQINVLDDTQTWLVRQPPTTLIKQLSFGEDAQRQYGKTFEGVQPFYRLIIRPSGRIESIIKRGYKIDFLFGVIGGVFMFYYFIFHWLAKIYNSFKTRAKLAQVHYQEQMYDENLLNTCFHLSSIPMCLIPNCCSIKDNVSRMRIVDAKIKKQLYYLDLIKVVDNCWRLSSAFYTNIIQKDWSLIYLREKIDEMEEVRHRVDENEVQNAHQEFQNQEYQIQMEYIKGSQKVANTSNIHIEEQLGTSNNINDSKMSRSKYQRQDLYPKYAEAQSSCLDRITWFDVFNVKAELTFNRERKVRSICGGAFCCLLTLFILLILVHFVGLYLNNADFTVGLDDRAARDGEDQIILNYSNFRFMYTFYKQSNYQFLNISAYLPYLGMDIVQVTFRKTNGSVVPQQVRTPFQPCSQSYLTGFVDEFINLGYYDSIQTGFCIPRNLTLTINGHPGQSETKQFYFDIYDKVNTTDSFKAVSEFMSKYYSFYHISSPIRDFQSRIIKYNMVPLREQKYLSNTSQVYNISLMKYKFNRQTDFYGNRRSMSSYAYQNYDLYEYRNNVQFSQGSTYRKLYFNFNNRVKEYTLDIPGIRELFGLVGGVIILFIFGFGCCVGSFNDYRLRYLIGRELYIFDRREKQEGDRNKSSAVSMSAINNYNQLRILSAWALSSLGYFCNNYNFWDTLKHITLIQQRVSSDLDIFRFSKKLTAIEKELNDKYHLGRDPSIKLSRVYAKDVYIPEIERVTSHEVQLISKNNNLTFFQQKKMLRAKEKKLDPNKVFNAKYLQKFYSDGESANSEVDMSSAQDIDGGKNQKNQSMHKLDGGNYRDSQQKGAVNQISRNNNLGHSDLEQLQN